MDTSGEVKMTKKQTSRQSKTRLTSGLTSTDICEIIKACKDNDVSTLEYGDLKLHIRQTPKGSPMDIAHAWGEGGVLHHVPHEHVTNELEINGELSDNETDVENIEIDLNEAALADPVLYERIMHGGEL